MNKAYQELIASLSGQQQLLLTTLLSCEDTESWEQSKHLIVCPMPLLTLEMAINRVSTRTSDSIPSPKQIYDALNYAVLKHQQYLQQPEFDSVANC